MPTYSITAPNGKTLDITGDHVPTEPELHEIFAKAGVETGAAVRPDFATTNEPPSTALKAAAYGKDAMQLALDALPGAGAVVGGVLATPADVATGPGGTLAGAALGAGAGRGLRDVIAAGLGLQKPTTAMGEGKAIAMDTAETYVAGKVLPALWEAIKAPGATVADVYDGMRRLYAVSPKAVKAFMPDFEALAKLPRGVGKAPASILERPAWQTWQEHLPPETAAPSAPGPRPSGPPGPTAAPAGPPPPPPVAPVSAGPGATNPGLLPDYGPPTPAVIPPPAPPPTPPPSAGLRPTPESAAIAAALPDQKALNEAALAARRAAYQQASAPAAPAGPVVAASGKMQLTAPEFVEFRRLIQRGVSLPDAERAIKLARELATQLGAEPPPVSATRFPKLARSSNK